MSYSFKRIPYTHIAWLVSRIATDTPERIVRYDIGVRMLRMRATPREIREAQRYAIEAFRSKIAKRDPLACPLA